MDILARLMEDYIRVQFILVPVYAAYFLIAVNRGTIRLRWALHILILCFSFILPIAFYCWRALHPVAILIFPGSIISGATNSLLQSAISRKFYFTSSTLALCGIIFFLVLLLKQFLLETRIRRAGTHVIRSGRVMVSFSPLVQGPFTTGLFNKHIYLPARLREERETRGCILEHEINHIRQNHIYFAILDKVHQCIGWFNPLSHVLAAKGGELRELLCDLKTTESRDPVVYSRILVAEAEMFSYTGKYALAEMLTEKGSFFKRRITMLLSNKDLKPGKKTVMALVLSLVLGAGIWMLIGCGNFTDEEEKVVNPAPAAKTNSSGRTMEEIREQVLTKIGGIRYAYNAALKKAPDLNLKGKITAKFTVRQDGSVSEAGVVSSSMNHAELETEIITIIKRWNFGYKEDAGDVKVVYPFIFTPPKQNKVKIRVGETEMK